MRIALVVAGDLDSLSGGYLYDRKLVSFLEASGHDVEVVSLPVTSYSRQLLENVCGHARRLSAFDIVLEDGLAHPSLPVANWRLETPTVALLHMLRSRTVADDIWGRFVEGVEARFLRSVDAAVHNSAATRRDARRLGCPLPDIVAQPGGDRFAPEVDADESRRRARSGPLELCFLGTLVERKGLDILVEGLARTDVDWRLTVVGDPAADPEYVTTVRRRIGRLGVDDRVQFAGRLDDTALTARLRAADVLALPSRYEPFGIAYLEGMSFGCVPLATTEGGASEFVTDGVSGMVVPPEPAAVAAALDALSDRNRLERMQGAARRAYERQPTWAESLDRIERFLRAVRNGGPPTRFDTALRGR